jgi:hypothetical protein
MSRIRIAGLLIFLLGMGMLILGAGMFTYRGDALTPFVSKLVEFSFIYWIPTVIIGIALFIAGQKSK